MNKLRQRLTLDHVKQAIHSLQEQGIKPTANQILAEVIRSSNGTVGGSKGTVLKLKRQLNCTNNCTKSTVQYGTETVPIGTDNSLLGTLEVQLWTKLEARLDDKLREQLAIYQVNRTNEYPLDEALQELREFWLDSVAQYKDLESDVQRLSQLVQTKDEEIEELSLENSELKLRLSQNNEVQSTNQTETQQSQPNPLSPELNELRELWLEAVFQITTPSTSVNTTIGMDPLDGYFQVLNQLHNLSPAQKYDCAMKLFEQGIGTSEASRILKVNKGSLQHYKDGKRKRPRSEGIPSPEVTPHGVFQENGVE
jgi:regulator of replication initiation timing